MAHAQLPIVQRGFGETMRRDAWWVQPLTVFSILSGFIVYATWAAFQNEHYAFGPYLSPFYSPELFGESTHAWFGARPGLWPTWAPYSPAFLILPLPALFRFTCYYYRGAYYKGFWADPPACAVGEPRKSYWGEKRLPLLLQNLHRYVLYGALLFLLILTYDVWQAMWFTNGVTGQREFGIGVGTLVLATNLVLLSGYTLGCHSLRHLVGGYRDELANAPVRMACYQGCTKLNRRHQLFAWTSLFAVAFADLYVRLCSMGIWRDWRIL